MASPKYPDALSSPQKTPVVKEDHIETAFLNKLSSLKYTLRPDITNRATLEKNFREKFDALNLLCFLELFAVSNHDQTFCFATNNARHFALNAYKLLNSVRLSTGETELSFVS